MTVTGRGRLRREDVRIGGYRPRHGGGGGTWRGIIFLGILAAVVLGGAVLVGGPAFRDFARNTARDNPQALRFPFIADVIRDDLGDALEDPAGTDPTPITFVVTQGASVSRIGRDLAEAGLISDALVFQYLVITRDLGSDLQVGNFTLNKTMTPGEIVDRLRQPPDPPPPKVTFAPRAGLRIEQVVALLQTLDVELDAEEFYDVALNPPDSLREEYDWMEIIPEGRSLEGFLMSGVYELDRDIEPLDLIKLMLDRWERDIGPAYIDEAERADRDFYEVLILASIVEKEAGLAEERPIIAGVYQNRLDGRANGVRLLNADPTVIYANDTMELRKIDVTEWPEYSFWGLIGVPSLNDFEVADDLQGFQTYQTPGLPPWPIDSPTVDAIESALEPDTESGYLYFVACGEGAHRFAETLREHNRNVAECQRQ